MKKANLFGEFIKELRLLQGLGLREFCRKFEHDAGNWSKIERGLLYPPDDEVVLENWAGQLGLIKGTSEWLNFFDYASINRGKIPKDILSEAEFVNTLPVFFRTIRSEKPSKEDLEKLVEILKKQIPLNEQKTKK